ncbi:hypothetical protein Taro_050221, partial [Colocasia esculenta]|nr:hypothetical protein [Colocasia esculenta]
ESDGDYHTHEDGEEQVEELPDISTTNVGFCLESEQQGPPQQLLLHHRLARNVPLLSPKSSSSTKLLSCRNPKCVWMHTPKFLDQCQDYPLNASIVAGCSLIYPPYIVIYGTTRLRPYLARPIDSPSHKVIWGLGGGGVVALQDDRRLRETRWRCPKLHCVVLHLLHPLAHPPVRVASFVKGMTSLPSYLGLCRFFYCLISCIYDNYEGAMGNVILEGSLESSREGLSFTPCLSFTPFLRNPVAIASSHFYICYYLNLCKITVDGTKVRIPHATLLPLPSGDDDTIIYSDTTFTS